MMRLPFGTKGRDDYAIRPLEDEDSAALAALHRENFARPWTDGEFAALLAQDTVFGHAAIPLGRPRAAPVGFVLARHAADEAEILTVVVAGGSRRRGVGRLLMDAVLRELHAARAEALFLEVDEANAAAVALYRRLGFRQVATRPGYYRDAASGRGGALVMRRDLR